jgi:hypothetical protein
LRLTSRLGYGSVSHKGDDTSERPHRLSRLIDVPANLQLVTPEQIAELAALVAEPDPPCSSGRARSAFSVQEWGYLWRTV